MRVKNKAEGKTYGIEVVADWQEWNPWRLRAIYSYLQMDLKVDENSFDLETEAYAKENPDHQLKLVSHLDLPGRLELDVTARYMDELSNLNIDHYLTFDIHLGWHPCKRLEMSLVGHNLLDSPHPEFVSRASGTLATRVEVGVYGALSWKF